jgi:hypothetical protein
VVTSPGASVRVDSESVGICAVENLVAEDSWVDSVGVHLPCSVGVSSVDGLTDETEEILTSCSAVFVISPVTVCAVLDCTDFGSMDDEMPDG